MKTAKKLKGKVGQMCHRSCSLVYVVSPRFYTGLASAHHSGGEALGGSRIKKEGGGNEASLHSAMFDSAQVRGLLRCYDAIDRIVHGLSLSLRCLLSE